MKLSIWLIWKMQCWTRWTLKWITIQPASSANNTPCRQNLQANNSSRASWTTSNKSSSSRRTKLEKTIIKARRWTKKMILQIRIRNILRRQARLDLTNKARAPARKRKSWRSSSGPRVAKLRRRWPLLTWQRHQAPKAPKLHHRAPQLLRQRLQIQNPAIKRRRTGKTRRRRRKQMSWASINNQMENPSPWRSTIRNSSRSYYNLPWIWKPTHPGSRRSGWCRTARNPGSASIKRNSRPKKVQALPNLQARTPSLPRLAPMLQPPGPARSSTGSKSPTRIRRNQND